MTESKYCQTILDTLQGRTPELREIPSARLDWEGVGALILLYRQTSGSDREALIRAMGKVIEDGRAPPAILAQLVQIASGLDLAQVEPQVRQLQTRPIASDELLQRAIGNYLAFRKLDSTSIAPRPNGNGKPNSRKPQAERIGSKDRRKNVGHRKTNSI